MIKISIVGTHGIPARHGGFETYAEEISQLLVKAGHKVSVQCDATKEKRVSWKGVDLFYSAVTKSEHPLRYYYSGIKSSLKISDVIIIAGTPGALFYFLNFFKRKVLITNTDGIEYHRAKWSLFHRSFLRFTEMLAVRFSDIVIADSESIRNILNVKFNSSAGKLRVIEYGSYINNKYVTKYLEAYKLAYRGFYLVVSRLEPENNLVMIIEGYLRSGSILPLFIIGNVTPTRYVYNLIKTYSSDKVIFTGGIYDKAVLSSLRYGCKAYLHGHSVGGTNPSLLEAMGNGNLIVCHDNAFNREVTGNYQFYFSDAEDCSKAIQRVEQLGNSEIEIYREKAYARIREYYNWDNMLGKYTQLFDSLKIGSKS